MDFETMKREAAKYCRMVDMAGCEALVNRSKTEGELRAAVLYARDGATRVNPVVADRLDDLNVELWKGEAERMFGSGVDGEGI